MRTGLSVSAGLLASTFAFASPVIGQELARQGTLSFSQGLEFSDNISLSATERSGFTSRTGVDLLLQTETRTQVLSFGIGTDLVGEFGGDLPDDDFDFESSRANILYTREGASSLFRFTGSYTETQLDESTFDLGGGSGVIISEGAVTRTSLGFGLTTGVDGPVELSLNGNHRKLDYQDTVDPDLIDETSKSVDGTARLRLNPAVTLRATAGVTRTDEEDAVSTERDERYVGLGFETETAGGLSIVGDVLYDVVETSDTTPSTSRDDGIGVDLGLTQDRPDGSIQLALSSRIDEAGRRSTAEVTRSYDMPAGEIAFSLGVLDQEGEDSLQVVGGLEYTRELPRGGITASLRQDASSRDGAAFLNTLASLDYAQEINAVSGWSAGISYTASDRLGGVDDDSRTTATFTYTRELAEDWSMSTGVEHTRVTDTGTPDRSSNAVFFNIRRDITFGF